MAEHPWGPPGNKGSSKETLARIIRDFISACENEPDGDNFHPHIGKAMVEHARRALKNL